MAVGAIPYSVTDLCEKRGLEQHLWTDTLGMVNDSERA